MKIDALTIFRKVALIEGISYLLIFLIGYPARIFFSNPLPMRIIGMSHGVLFIAFVVLLCLVWLKHSWSFWQATFAFLLSLVPFGTFYMEYRIKKGTW